MMRGSLAAVLVTLCAWPAGAQRPSDIVHWSAKAPARGIRAGAAVKVEVKAEIEPGWHVYALTQPKGGLVALTLGVAKPEPFEVKTAAIEGPLPTVAVDPVTKLETHSYAGTIAFTVPIVAGKGARPGKRLVPIEITFQACDPHICLRPATETVPVEITVVR